MKHLRETPPHRRRHTEWTLATAPVVGGFRLIWEQWRYDGYQEQWDWDWHFADDPTVYETETHAREQIASTPKGNLP